jgi:hypothetical protein
MKKLFTILIAFTFQFNTSAQVTQGVIYNFEIGDVLQTKFTTTTNPPVRYELDTIVDKVVSGNSISYTIHRYVKLDGPPPYPQISNSVETLNIVATLPAEHVDWFQSCLSPIDSIYVGNCGQNVYNRISDADTSCFEPPNWTSSLYEGLGGPYFYGNDPSNPFWYVQKELIYSNTSQWGECGQYQSWFVGVEELSNTPKSLVKIIDLLGREVNFEPNKTLIYIYSDGSVEKMYTTQF